MTTLALRSLRWTGTAAKRESVWLTLIALLLGLAVFLPAQFPETLRFTVDAFVWILPFLLLSTLTAAWLKAAGADGLIGRAVGERPVHAILVMAALGALSPFCSCGVVPLVAALLAAGVPLPAVMAFWIASPLMDPEQFVLMVPILGVDFAVVKAASALLLGLAAGFAMLAMQRVYSFEGSLKTVGCGGCGGSALSKGPVVWRFWESRERRVAFAEESKSVFLFLSKWLLLAFALESLMVAWLPPEQVATWLGEGSALAVPLAVAVGVPAYLNSYAAIPLIGELINTGMSPSAGIAFMIAGGVTSLPAAMAVFALVRLPVFFCYLGLSLAGALAIGYGVDALGLLG